jgi:hypothetical protein
MRPADALGPAQMKAEQPCACDRCEDDGAACGDYIGPMEKIIWREAGQQLRHTYEEMTPEKRPQDVHYKGVRCGAVLGRRDGTGLQFLPREHGYDACPEAIVVKDWFRGEATYVVQDSFSDTSQRPQSHSLDGRELSFETLEHGGEYPDDMPQAIRVIDPQGRSAIYRPIMEDGKVVDSKGLTLEPADSEAA